MMSQSQTSESDHLVESQDMAPSTINMSQLNHTDESRGMDESTTHITQPLASSSSTTGMPLERFATNVNSDQMTQAKKTEVAWRDEDFPYWNDVTQTLQSPITTPPATPKPDNARNSSTSYTSMSLCTGSVYDSKPDNARNSSTSYTSMSLCTGSVYDSKPDNARNSSTSYTSMSLCTGSVYDSMASSSRMTSSYSSIPSSFVQSPSIPSSYGRSRYMTASEPDTLSSAASNFPSSFPSDVVHMAVSKGASQTSRPASYYNSSIALSVYDSQANYSSSSFDSSVSNVASQGAYSTSSYETSTSSWISTEYLTDSSGQDTVVSFFNAGNEEDHIPFQDGKPTISKFGPISRAKFGNTMMKATMPVRATADEMMKTVPVTAVTPLSVPPLPNTQTVPSRFRTSDDNLCQINSMPEGGSYEKSYSLWTTEVNLLEQKAKDANTEDERLTVKLKAVEMQITLKEQELSQAHAVQQAQCEASEYMKRQQQENNSQQPSASMADILHGSKN